MLTKQEELKVLAMFVPNADLISDAARAEKLQYGTPVRWFQEHRGAAITVRQHTYGQMGAEVRFYDNNSISRNCLTGW